MIAQASSPPDDRVGAVPIQIAEQDADAAPDQPSDQLSAGLCRGSWKWLGVVQPAVTTVPQETQLEQRMIQYGRG
eukprot:2467702-Rhodomonas_salina.3